MMTVSSTYIIIALSNFPSFVVSIESGPFRSDTYQIIIVEKCPVMEITVRG